VGNSGVSAQMMFLQSNGQVIILDKTENNPVSVAGHPAWAVAYNYNANTYRTMDVTSNTFCAGGMTLGDGRWIVVGGNKAVGAGGVDAKAGAAPYKSTNGGKSIRLLHPCSGNDCAFKEKTSNSLSKERWYATVEPLRDGHVAILGGMRDGGFVPSQGSNEPTYEFYPKVGEPTYMDILKRSVPLSLYPITYLLSDNRLFVQANKQTILWNTDTLQEEKLPSAPVPINYPASGGSALLPLRPSNNYKETILECGGMSLGKGSAWGNEGGPAVMVTERPASNECNTIEPLGDKQWKSTDSLAEGRSMGQFIQLPTGELVFLNGVTTGVAGYTTDPNQVGKPKGRSFGDNPSYQPVAYNPEKPAGQRWRNLAKANVGRLYHSSATLLPDGSVLVSGSNPNPDVTNKHWKTEYSVERLYLDYHDKPRPSNSALPSSFSYGGQGFSIQAASASAARNTKVVIVRTGFSTHAMNMGQRMIELRTSVSGSTVNVAQLPPNPALFAPGPALAFVVVDGVPSQGKFITVGNGKVGAQPTAGETQLPAAGNARIASQSNS
ncbi:Glyoxaloxidase 2, partial [Ceraceosorus guamensis]